jgi:hypothetical protein
MMVTFAVMLLPERVNAWPTKFTDCASCHTTVDATATISTAIDGVVGTSVTVAPGGSFEVDFRFTNATNAAGAYNVGLEIMVPDNTWTIASGTANSPAIAGWNTVWDAADGHAWATGSGFAVGTFAGTLYGYTIDYGGSAWDGDGTGGGKTRNPAEDGAANGGTDLDGTADTMGADAIVNVPAGATPGVYTVYVLGVGHEGSSKSNVSQAITVTVSGGADTTPPNVTTTTPTNGATGVALDGQVTINFDENIDCATVNTTNITSDSPGWALNTCSGAQATFDTSGQANSTTYNVSVTGAVTDVAGNPLNAAPYNFSYTTAAAGNTPPSLTISQPDGVGDTVTVGAAFNVTYDLSDPDNVVTAAFYYDTDNVGYNGTAISGACASAAEGTGVSCSWDTTGMTPGSYYVYGAANDGVNPAAQVYSSGTLTINEAPVAPNAPSDHSQYQSDGTTPISQGGSTNETTVVIKATVSDPNAADTVSLEVEFIDNGSAFAGTPTHTSTAVTNGSVATVTVSGLTDGTSYKWQARTSDGSLQSSWTAFGGSDPDVTIAIPDPPNTPAASAQFESDGTTPLAGGGTAAGSTVVIQADLSDPDAGDKVILEVDIDSDGTPDCVSGYVTVPATAQASCSALADASYDWQARAKDLAGQTSAWQALAGTPDFVIATGMAFGVDTTAPVDGTLSATPGDQQVALSWTPATDAGIGLDAVNTYEIVYGAPTAPACSGVGTTNVNATTIGALTNGTGYEFRVCAYDKLGWGSAGATVTATPTVGDTTQIGDGTAPANKTAGPSDIDVAVSTFTLSTTAGTDTVTQVAVGGTNTANLAAVHLYSDNGTTPNEWDATDTWIADTTFSGGTATFGSLGIGVNTTPAQYLVTYDIAAAPTDGQTLTASVSSIVATNSVSNGDNADATVTIDAAGPTVSTTTPTNGATGVGLDQLVTINFNEAVNDATVDETSVTISPAVTWTKSGACSGATCTFQPTGQAGSILYTVTVGTGAQDVYGNASPGGSFGYTTLGTSTVVGDGVSPANKQVLPGAVNLAVSAFTLATTSGGDTATAIQVTGVNVTGNVAAGSVRLYADVNGDSEYDGGDTQVGTVQSFSAGVATFSGLSEAVTSTPKAYIVVFSVDAAAANGAAMTASVTSVTATNAISNSDTADATITVDAAAPSVTTTTPASGAAGVAPNTSLVINWTENVDCTTVNTTNITISGGSLGTVTCTPPTSSATIAVSGQATDSSYTVTVGTGVNDVVGNAMAGVYPFTYTTTDTAAPTSSVNAIAGTLIPADFPYTVTGTASDALSGVNTVEVSIDGGPWNPATDTGGGTWATWSYSWANPGADGTYTIQSRATDSAAVPNVETPGAGQNASVDVTAPTLNKPGSTPAGGSTGNLLNGNVTLVWSENVDCGTVNLTNVTIDGGASLDTVQSCSANSATFTVSGQTNNTLYTVNVNNVADVAGNTMTADNLTYTTEAAPCVRGVPGFTVDSQKYVPESSTGVYTVTIVNTDSSCGSSSFTVSWLSDTETPGPNGTSFAVPSALAPVHPASTAAVASGGSSNTITLTVTTQAGAVDGDYLDTQLQLTSDSGAAEHAAQTITPRTTVKNFNPLVHSSLSTASTKHATDGGWGVSGGKYGEFVCATCHTKSTTNAKRVKTVLDPAPDISKGDFPGSGVGIAFTDARDGSSQFGDDDPNANSIADRASSNRICEVCHSITTHHRYDQTVDPDGAGPLVAQTSWNHNNKTDCTACHAHSAGFKADGACDNCHGYPPHDAYPPDPSPSDGKAGLDGGIDEGKGAHLKHVDRIQALAGVGIRDPLVDQFGDARTVALCGPCHWMDASNHETGGNTSGRTINFNGAATYQFGPSAPNFSGVPGTSSATDPKKCSNVSCHFQQTPQWQ